MTRSSVLRLLSWGLGGLALMFVIQNGINQNNEGQQAIITQFGEPVRAPITAPGLFLDVPIVQTENYFDKRLLEYENQTTQVPTRDKRYISVSAFAVWRISDALTFFRRVQDENGARARLTDIFDGEIRSAVARYDLIELVRNATRNAADVSIQSEGEAVILQPLTKGRRSLEREVLERASARAADLGIRVLDVRFKRMSYIDEVQKSVFARMIAERQQMAQEFISQGQGEAARITGERDRDVARIQSEAYRTGEQERGRADAEATKIYADANGRDADFYAFVKSLDTYERALDPGTVMILDSDSELFKYLGRSR
jgi:modulator of FtsH protease HflC